IDTPASVPVATGLRLKLDEDGQRSSFFSGRFKRRRQIVEERAARIRSRGRRLGGAFEPLNGVNEVTLLKIDPAKHRRGLKTVLRRAGGMLQRLGCVLHHYPFLAG